VTYLPPPRLRKFLLPLCILRWTEQHIVLHAYQREYISCIWIRYRIVGAYLYQSFKLSFLWPITPFSFGQLEDCCCLTDVCCLFIVQILLRIKVQNMDEANSCCIGVHRSGIFSLHANSFSNSYIMRIFYQLAMDRFSTKCFKLSYQRIGLLLFQGIYTYIRGYYVAPCLLFL